MGVTSISWRNLCTTFPARERGLLRSPRFAVATRAHASTAIAMGAKSSLRKKRNLLVTNRALELLFLTSLVRSRRFRRLPRLPRLDERFHRIPAHHTVSRIDAVPLRWMAHAGLRKVHPNHAFARGVPSPENKPIKKIFRVVNFWPW